jgi:enhancer of mRNA-decapping protein 4
MLLKFIYFRSMFIEVDIFQVDLRWVLTMDSLPLGQVVLLHLLWQLTFCVNNSAQKFAWMTDVANAIIPTDPTIAMHVQLIYNEVYGILYHQRTLPTITSAELSSIQCLMNVIALTLGNHA